MGEELVFFDHPLLDAVGIQDLKQPLGIFRFPVGHQVVFLEFFEELLTEAVLIGREHDDRTFIVLVHGERNTRRRYGCEQSDRKQCL